ncbi:sulfatase-like hydrolase/transferase [Streptomyces sp. 3MP-14]|uniref:Sulfatase-like hydrolase/transferase n=1 Tax=Streptomyces mimosae TaxID=2586635 RepID=A0A5N5ZRK4_9ACTN|nr:MULTISPECIES: sulfatase [Streptomyces]KAB8158905.1 sulfatase-like hydrolase/transferase [Streptomyces mimosae]KAB8174855.1 sulfatase-like hydrolase/transferase [Streptomyces sp. 3MP-14]
MSQQATPQPRPGVDDRAAAGDLAPGDDPARGGLSRRGFIAGTAAAASLGALAGAANAPNAVARARDARPNVLLIVTDDQPKRTEWAIPRTVDWLAGRGVRYTNGHVTTPLCSPSRSSVLSGRYAHHHGVRNNQASYQLDQSTTIQRHLAEAGYRTGLFGKFLNAWQLADNPPHFEEFALLSPGYVDARWNVNGAVQQLPGYTTTIIREETLRFIERSTSDDRPWFAYVTPYAPHGPNTPEPDYAEVPVPAWNGRPSVPEEDRSDKPPYIQNATGTLADGRRIRRNQLRTLLSVDDTVEAFRQKLAELGQLENTLVIYIADNGFSWGDHGWTKKSVPYRQAHEVPFYASWPAGGLGGGRRDDRIVANIDIAPTVLDAAGVVPDHEQDGISLLSDRSRDHLLVEWWKQGDGAAGPRTWASYVAKDRQYTEYYALTTNADGEVSGGGEVTFREYYDLVNDQHQLTNALHQADEEDEANLGIAELAAQLAADRAG